MQNVKEVMVFAHGSSCSLKASTTEKIVELDPNVLIVMNCDDMPTSYAAVTQARILAHMIDEHSKNNDEAARNDIGLGTSAQNAKALTEEEIVTLNYLKMQLVSLMSATHVPTAFNVSGGKGSIKGGSAKTTSFCMYTKRCPNIQFEFADSGDGTYFPPGVFELPVQIQDGQGQLLSTTALDKYVSSLRDVTRKLGVSTPQNSSKLAGLLSEKKETKFQIQPVNNTQMFMATPTSWGHMTRPSSCDAGFVSIPNCQIQGLSRIPSDLNELVLQIRKSDPQKNTFHIIFLISCRGRGSDVTPNAVYESIDTRTNENRQKLCELPYLDSFVADIYSRYLMGRKVNASSFIAKPKECIGSTFKFSFGVPSNTGSLTVSQTAGKGKKNARTRKIKNELGRS